MKVNGVLQTDPGEVAESFNSYFTNIAHNLDSDIPLADIDPMYYVPGQCNSFVCLPTDSTEVMSVVVSFKNKKSSISAIPSFVYKNIADIISPTIAALINCSFVGGIFPDILKKARVVPNFCEQNI